MDFIIDIWIAGGISLLVLIYVACNPKRQKPLEPQLDDELYPLPDKKA